MIRAPVYIRLADVKQAAAVSFHSLPTIRQGKWYRLLGLKSDGRLILKKRFAHGIILRPSQRALDVLYGGCKLSDVHDWTRKPIRYLLRAKTIAQRLEKLRSGMIFKPVQNMPVHRRFPVRIGSQVEQLKRILRDSPFRTTRGVWSWWYNAKRREVYGSPYDFSVNTHPVLDHPEIVAAWMWHQTNCINNNLAIVMRAMALPGARRDVLFGKIMSYSRAYYKGRNFEMIFHRNQWGVWMPNYSLVCRGMLRMLIGTPGCIGPCRSVLDAFREIDHARTMLAVYNWPSVPAELKSIMDAYNSRDPSVYGPLFS